MLHYYLCVGCENSLKVLVVGVESSRSAGCTAFCLCLFNQTCWTSNVLADRMHIDAPWRKSMCDRMNTMQTVSCGVINSAQHTTQHGWVPLPQMTPSLHGLSVMGLAGQAESGIGTPVVGTMHVTFRVCLPPWQVSEHWWGVVGKQERFQNYVRKNIITTWHLQLSYYMRRYGSDAYLGMPLVQNGGSYLMY